MCGGVRFSLHAFTHPVRGAQTSPVAVERAMQTAMAPDFAAIKGPNLSGV
jgi:hypothetical protein